MKHIKQIYIPLLILIFQSCAGVDALQSTKYPIMVGKMVTPKKSFAELKSKMYIGQINVSNSYSNTGTTVGNSRVVTQTSKQGVVAFSKNLERLKLITRVGYFYQSYSLGFGGTYEDEDMTIDVFDKEGKK